MGEKFGVSEIVDTLQDAVRIELDVKESVLDGKYTAIEALTDAVSNYPRIAEAVNDWKTFTQELSDYSVDENNRIADLVGGAFTEEQKKESHVFGAIQFLTGGYSAYHVIRLELDQLYLMFLTKVLKRANQG